MQESDKKQFKGMMDATCAIYSRNAFDNEVLRIWFYKLRAFEFPEVCKAFDKWIDTNKKMATPADIIELCKEYKNKNNFSKLSYKPTKDQIIENRKKIQNIINGLAKNKLMDIK